MEMSELTVKYNELSAAEFILLWETVWGQGPYLDANRDCHEKYDIQNICIR